MQRGTWAAIACAIVGLSHAGAAIAQVAWRGDFETGDTSQFDTLLNGEYVTVQGDIVAHGSYAARVELHDDAVWPNGLKRVELNHMPESARTAEGATTYFAWSFYLPEALPTEPYQTIGYWESENSWQQVMAFDVTGTTITFSTRRPSNQVQWRGEGVATPGEWHRIAMRVRWSTSAAGGGAGGSVDVWFDGEQVVTGGSAQTLADGNPHFAQIGLLRPAVSFSDVPVIVIDDVLEGDTLDDVRPGDLPGVGMPDAGVMADAGTSADGGASESDAGAGVDAGASGEDAGARADAGHGDDEISGSSCAVDPGARRNTTFVVTLLSLAALALARRRR